MGWELELTDAVYNNDVELVRSYCKDKEIRKSLGRPEWMWSEAPIHRAAAIGRNDILKMLLDAGGSLKSYSIHDNDDKLTCLHLAVWCNQAETVKLLLNMGADANMPGTWLDYTGTAWDFALQYKHQDIINLFREHVKDGKFGGGSTNAGTMLSMSGGKIGGAATQVVTRVSTSAILTGLENLPMKEKALRKANDLQKKNTRAEKNLQEAKKRLAVAEKEVFDIQSNPYFLSLDAIDELTMEIEELKMFSVEVKKVLGDRSSSQPSGFGEQRSERRERSSDRRRLEGGSPV